MVLVAAAEMVAPEMLLLLLECALAVHKPEEQPLIIFVLVVTIVHSNGKRMGQMCLEWGLCIAPTTQIIPVLR